MSRPRIWGKTHDVVCRGFGILTTVSELRFLTYSYAPTTVGATVNQFTNLSTITMKSFLSVIIPAYNEASRLPLTLIDVDRHLSEQDYEYEVIVVNDGSTDGTAEMVKRFASLMKHVKFINNPTNMGKAAALRIGMLAAKGEWCVAMDASNTVSIVEFTKMLPYVRSGAVDILVGSRRVQGASVRPRFSLGGSVLDFFANLFALLLLRLNVHDALSGFFVVSREAAHRIFAVTKFNGWIAEIELLALARVWRYRVKEVPVFAASKKGSHSRARDYLQMIGEMIKMRWWLSRGKYQLE